MKIYLVGGAVRDQLLGLSIHDRDYVVVGATPEQMRAQGYTQVGKSFPVFLSPHSGEEYALARTERKTGQGYTGFSCDFSPEISLETDLQRRDLTINAIAQTAEGELIDPYGGQRDIEQRVLRHVSDAFSEDPLRVLRVARFAARLAPLGFTIADETISLMTQMTQSGELNVLTAERIYNEIEKTLACDTPEVFFQTLRQCGALHVIMPELDTLFGIPAPENWHPEIDTGVHTMLTLQQAVRLSDSIAIRFAAICHDLGKAATDPAKWPSHRGHDELGVPITETLCQRLKVPNTLSELAIIACKYHIQCHKQYHMSDEELLNLLDGCDAWRKPERFEQLLTVCKADIRGRTGHENDAYPQAEQLLNWQKELVDIDIQAIIKAGFKGSAIRDELRRQRLAKLAQLRSIH